jgi:hypothetical protein
VDHCYCTFQKHEFRYFHYFSQKQSFREYFVLGPRIQNDWCGKTTLRRTMHPIWLYIVYMGVVPVPKKKRTIHAEETMHMRMMDSGFAILYLLVAHNQLQSGQQFVNKWTNLVYSRLLAIFTGQNNSWRDIQWNIHVCSYCCNAKLTLK